MKKFAFACLFVCLTSCCLVQEPLKRVEIQNCNCSILLPENWSAACGAEKNFYSEGNMVFFSPNGDFIGKKMTSYIVVDYVDKNKSLSDYNTLRQRIENDFKDGAFYKEEIDGLTYYFGITTIPCSVFSYEKREPHGVFTGMLLDGDYAYLWVIHVPDNFFMYGQYKHILHSFRLLRR